jgi:glycine/D-amino acid oxidase-like deaminating enzyme
MTTIVVGGGIIGACTLYELARAGEDALLLEAGTFARGGTGKSGAIVRTHYSNPEVVRMAVRSRDVYLSQPFYDRCGWLFLVDEENAELARRNRDMQFREGAGGEEVDAAEFGVATEGVGYALFEPDSGFADPVAATLHFIEAARRDGAEAREGSPVDAVEPGRGVRSGGQLLEADNVVLAAGPWTKKLAAAIGLDVPLETPREQDVVFDMGGAPLIRHAVSSQVDRVYMRPYGDGGMLAGRGYPKSYELVDPERYDETIDADFAADVLTRVKNRLPGTNGLRAVGGHAGLYDVTPDWHPILGGVDGYDGLFLATGGSGHCFKLGPAIGELVAGAVLGRDVSDTFSLSRFAEGRELLSTYGGNRG